MKEIVGKLKHIHPLLAIAVVAFILAFTTAVIPNNQVKTDIKGAQTVVKKELVKPSVAPTKAIDSNSKVLDNPPAGGPTATITPQKSLNSNQNSTSHPNLLPRLKRLLHQFKIFR